MLLFSLQHPLNQVKIYSKDKVILHSKNSFIKEETMSDYILLFRKFYCLLIFDYLKIFEK